MNPNEVSNFRDLAGLPKSNSGRFVVEGVLKDTKGITYRPALPLHGNIGGLPEYLIPDPEEQIGLERISGVNPEF